MKQIRLHLVAQLLDLPVCLADQNLRDIKPVMNADIDFAVGSPCPRSLHMRHIV